MVNCNFENVGCSGGYLTYTVDYLMVEGLVPNQCVAYTDAVNTCTYRCDNPKDTYDKYYCKPGSMKVVTSYEEIKEEIKVHGPVIVGLVIYDDFLNYESGIYKNVAGEVIGGHAVKMIGWGYDEVEGLFWILQN
jgi:cathepsin B